jgi:DNA-binding XRE family transcriptional regulator
MPKHKNQLQLYRRRMRFSQEMVARMLGDCSRSTVARFEDGGQFPSLLTALRLEILYRVPIAFCYPEMYNRLRDSLRAAEQTMFPPNAQQGVLF